MAARLYRLELRVCVAWWFMPYLHALAFFAALSDREPDLEKFRAVVARGVKLEPVMAEPKKPCERCQRARRALKRLLPTKKR